MIIRNCICIPTYNNEGAIEKVAVDCLEQTRFPVLIVDDGSKHPVEELLQNNPTIQVALASGRLRFIRFAVNRGKGVALQTAIKDCVREGFTHLFAVDGDGQHLVSEIPKLVEAARQNPWDLIIGNRRLLAATVPGASKFGRRFSNFWVGYQTGAAVRDSQSGFRLYPLFHLQNLRFFTRRYDFEIEVLIRLLWRGVNVREVEIDVYYPPQGERVSHFHKFWDNARISCLNTVLVTLSLLKSHRSPAATGLALGVGVLVGCTPFFGFHTAIVAALAVVLRLNAVLLWLGTQISIPPLAPFLILASVRTGSWITGTPIAGWLLGSLVVGAVLGTAVGVTAYLTARALQKKTARRKNWTGKTRGGTLGNWFLKTVAQRLGLKAAYFCLYFIIPYFYLFAPKARKSANEYWNIIRPDAGYLHRQWLVCRQLFEFGRLLLDRVFQGFSSTPRFKTNPNGIENILTPLNGDRGLIILGAHLGGWDLAASMLPADGLKGELHLLQFEANGLTLNKIADHKDRGHIKPVSQAAEPLMEVRKVLDQGKPVALMGDRPLAGHCELVPLCGKLAPFDTTAFRIAAACRSPLLFSFGFKGARNNYDFFATPSKIYSYESGKDRSLQVLTWTRQFAATLEGFIAKYPTQWSNFFPIWSAVPTSPEGEEASTARHSLIEELHRPAAAKPASAAASKPTAAPAPLL